MRRRNIIEQSNNSTPSITEVTDGLVNWWDAIQNTPNGHQNSPTVWTDRVSGNTSLNSKTSNALFNSNSLQAGNYAPSSGNYFSPVVFLPFTYEYCITYNNDVSSFIRTPSQGWYAFPLAGSWITYGKSGKGKGRIAFGAVYNSTSSVQKVVIGCQICTVTGGSSAKSKYVFLNDKNVNDIFNLGQINTSCITASSSGEIKIYVNGQLIGIGNIGGFTMPNSQGAVYEGLAFTIGMPYSMINPVHSVRVYNKILSDAQIAQQHTFLIDRYS